MSVLLRGVRLYGEGDPVDVLVDVKLLDYAARTYGAKKVGLILVNNPWGESNDKGLAEAVKAKTGMEIVGSEKFENNDVDMVPQLTRLKDKCADVLILAPEHGDRVPAELGGVFDAIERLPDASVTHAGGTLLRVAVFRGRRLRAWPPPG